MQKKKKKKILKNTIKVYNVVGISKIILKIKTEEGLSVPRFKSAFLVHGDIP